MKVFIKWRDEWLLGIENLDEQHKMIAGCLNRFVDEYRCKARAGAGNDKEWREKLINLAKELYTRTKEHFRDEETVMRREGYPGLAFHAREHAMLLAELKSTFSAQLNPECCTMNEETLEALKSWFVAHLSRSDREFYNYLNRNNPD